MTMWTNDGQSVWGVWERVGAYGACKFPDRWRLAKAGSRSMLYLTPKSARRASMRLMKKIGYTLLRPGELSIYISPETAKELDFSELRKIEIMLKDVMEHAQA